MEMQYLFLNFQVRVWPTGIFFPFLRLIYLSCITRAESIVIEVENNTN